MCGNCFWVNWYVIGAYKVLISINTSKCNWHLSITDVLELYYSCGLLASNKLCIWSVVRVGPPLVTCKRWLLKHTFPLVNSSLTMRRICCSKSWKYKFNSEQIITHYNLFRIDDYLGLAGLGDFTPISTAYELPQTHMTWVTGGLLDSCNNAS